MLRNPFDAALTYVFEQECCEGGGDDVSVLGREFHGRLAPVVDLEDRSLVLVVVAQELKLHESGTE